MVWNAIWPKIQHLKKKYNLTENDSTFMQNDLHLTSKRLNMAKTHQPAFFYIWPNDIDECRLVRFPMLTRMCMLIRFSRSPMPHLKGVTYG